MKNRRIAIAFTLGLAAFGVAIMADGMLGAARRPSRIGTFVIMGLYLAIAQFAVARKGTGFRATLPTLVAMAAPPVLMFSVTIVVESREVMLSQGVPGVLAGALGPLVGAIVAGRASAWSSRA